MKMGDLIGSLFLSAVISFLVYSIFIDPFVGKMEKDVDRMPTHGQVITNKNGTVDIIPPPEYGKGR